MGYLSQCCCMVEDMAGTASCTCLLWLGMALRYMQVHAAAAHLRG